MLDFSCNFISMLPFNYFNWTFLSAHFLIKNPTFDITNIQVQKPLTLSLSMKLRKIQIIQ